MSDYRVRRAWAIATAFALVLAFVNLSIWLAGAAPRVVWRLVYEGTFASGYGMAQTFAKATPLMLTGMAFAVALRGGLVNVGVEGQLAAGILAAAVVGARLPHTWPWYFAAPVAIGACAVAGAMVGGTAGWLKGRFGAHEVITTLMLNGLIAVGTTWLYGGPLRVPGQIHTRIIAPGARLPMAERWLSGLRGSALSLAIVLAVGAVCTAEWYLLRTSGGLRLRAVGSRPEAARALGVEPGRQHTRTLALAGAIAGLGGMHYVLGVKGYAEDGIGSGVGFVGIAVAMVGLTRAGGILLAALLFGLLGQGGLAVNAIVPADTLSLVQAASILAVATVAGVLSRARGAPGGGHA